jgi:hypothetical protein
MGMRTGMGMEYEDEDDSQSYIDSVSKQLNAIYGLLHVCYLENLA